MSEPSDLTDDLLMARLGAAARAVDPVPALVSESARALFGFQRLDAELAELVADSERGLAGVRGVSDEVRLLSFETPRLVVDVQVSGATVVGQVASEAVVAGVIWLERAGAAPVEQDLDELGRFRYERVAPGQVRLAVACSGGGSVTTVWFRV